MTVLAVPYCTLGWNGALGTTSNTGCVHTACDKARSDGKCRCWRSVARPCQTKVYSKYFLQMNDKSSVCRTVWFPAWTKLLGTVVMQRFQFPVDGWKDHGARAWAGVRIRPEGELQWEGSRVKDAAVEPQKRYCTVPVENGHHHDSESCTGTALYTVVLGFMHVIGGKPASHCHCCCQLLLLSPSVSIMRV